LSKKLIFFISIALLIFAGIIAVTQELDINEPVIDFELQEGAEDTSASDIVFKEPARWYKSNAGGLAIREVKSRIIALRSEYALSIDSANHDDLPEFAMPFYLDDYKIEVRSLYKKGIHIKTQWLLRDTNNKTRANAVIMEITEEIRHPVVREKIAVTVTDGENENENENEKENDEKNIEDETPEEIVEFIYKKHGFIELYNDELNVMSEYAYLKDGSVNRIDFEYNETFLTKAVFHTLTGDESSGKYVKTYADFYRYNRSSSLRTIERVFYTDMKAKEDDLVKISFPRNIRDVINENLFVNERLNIYPEFFGDVYIESDSKMVFDIDNRGRIIKQTLYDEEDEIIWVISNLWQNDRIAVTTKTEGDLTLSAEFEYNKAGDRISERNFKNGVTERYVRTEGKQEIEELYMNNAVVLRAVWEDGIKISETRVR